MANFLNRTTRSLRGTAAALFVATSLVSGMPAGADASITTEAELQAEIEMAFGGMWTKCVAWSGGKRWNVANGQHSQQSCFDWGRRCTGNPNANITYYSSPVLIAAPFEHCRAH